MQHQSNSNNHNYINMISIRNGSSTTNQRRSASRSSKKSGGMTSGRSVGGSSSNSGISGIRSRSSSSSNTGISTSALVLQDHMCGHKVSDLHGRVASSDVDLGSATHDYAIM